MILNRFSFLIVAGIITLAATAAPAQIKLTNHQHNQEIRYPLVLLRGTLEDASQTQISVINESSKRETRQLAGAAHKGHFKALAELLPGENKLLIQSGTQTLRITLIHKPQTNPYFVRAIYLTDKTGDTTYQTPFDKDAQNHKGKIDTILKLMQTFTAERMNDLGYGPQTFNIETDAGGKVIVHVVKGEMAAQDYYKLNDQAWYAKIYKELDRPYPMRFAKNFAVAAYTRFDPATGKPKGHTALGGGGLGLFGSGSMFAWPDKLQDVTAAFMDERLTDNTKVMDDSAGRKTHWGAASTTIGACLHEMGHTFGLPHTKEPLDIMTRGFDRFNRAFAFVDPPSAQSKTPVEFKDDRVAQFAPISASSLVTSRWFALDKKDWIDGAKPTATLDAKTGDMIVQGDRPIRYISFSVKGDAVHFLVPAKDTKKLTVTAAELKEKVKSDVYRVRIIDDQANTGSLDVGK